MPKPTTKSINISGAPNQQKNDKRLDPGTPTRLVNYRRFRDGHLDKRLGWHKTDITTFNGATYQGPATELHPSATAPLWSDSASQLWVRDSNSGQAHYRGTIHRATWSSTGLQNLKAPVTKPLEVERGDDVFCFSLHPDGYQLTVIDPITRVIKRETEAFTVTGVVAYAALLDASDNVCVFTVDGGTTIKRHAFASVTAAPTTTTWHTEAGAAFHGIDAAWMQSKAVVAAISSVTTTTGILRSHGSGTVAALTSYTSATTSGENGSNGLTVLEHDGANGFWYIAYFGNPLEPGGGVRTADLILEQVSLSNPATLSSQLLATVNYDNLAGMVGVSGGHVGDLGERVVFASFVPYHDTDYQPQGKGNMTVTRYTFNGFTVATEVVARAASIASKPFSVAGRRYILTHFDDASYDGIGVEYNVGIQNGYFLRDTDGNILATVLDGEAGVAFHGALGGDAQHAIASSSSHVTRPVVVGTKVFFFLHDVGTVRTSPGRRLVTIDMAATYFSSAGGIVPGGVPCRVSTEDVLTELSPIHYPNKRMVPVLEAGTLLSTNYVTVRFNNKDENGDDHPSAPLEIGDPLVFYVATPGELSCMLRCQTLRHVMGGTTEIQIFGSPPSGASNELYLQLSALNDPTVDYIDVEVHPSLWNSNGPQLETIGGGVEQASLPPARIAFESGRRLILGGTPDGQIWPSLERIPGEGYQFNQDLAFHLPAGAGELITGHDVDGLSFLLFAENGTFLATGAGPNGRGEGAYAISRVGEKGVTAASPFAVADHAKGVVFQGRNDRKMYLYAGGVVADVSEGMDDERSLEPAAALAFKTDETQVATFFGDEGPQLVLDQTFKDAPGDWIVHEGDGLPAAVGARVINGAPVLLEAGDETTAAIWSPSPGVNTTTDFLDDGVEVLTRYTSGRMQLAGPDGEFDTDTTRIASEHQGGDSTFVYRLISDRSTKEHPDVANTEGDLHFRSKHFRVNHLQLDIEETSATGKGRSFETLSLDVRPYDRPRLPPRKIG